MFSTKAPDGYPHHNCYPTGPFDRDLIAKIRRQDIAAVTAKQASHQSAAARRPRLQLRRRHDHQRHVWSAPRSLAPRVCPASLSRDRADGDPGLPGAEKGGEV